VGTNGQALAYVYFEVESARRGGQAAHARRGRIASNIAKLPELRRDAGGRRSSGVIEGRAASAVTCSQRSPERIVLRERFRPLAFQARVPP
jgi:hypothetical protein